MRGRIIHIALAVLLACSVLRYTAPPAQAAGGEVIDHNIDYSSALEADQYILPCPDNKDIYIDMLSEKLYVPGGITVVGISLDGGVKWKPVIIPSTGYDLSKAFNKGCFIQLTTSLNEKKKPYLTAEKDAEGAVTKPASTIYSFAAISARPKLSGYMVNFQVFEDKMGATPGQWALTSKGTNTVISGLQIALTADGKTPLAVLADSNGRVAASGSSAAWGGFPKDAGINVMPLSSSGKVVKTGYLVRVAPDMKGLVPASKVKKLKVAGLGKVQNFKADYKKEIVKLKANSRAFFGTQTELEENKNLKLVESFDKDQAKEGLDISFDMGEPVAIWIGATQKKPATAPKLINTAKRQLMEEVQPTFTAGSVKISTAKYEVYNDTKEVYGTAVPKVTGDGLHSFRIRQKATAKGGKENATTFAASEDGTLFIRYGTIEATGKKGILEAYIEAPIYDGVLRYRPGTHKLTAVEGSAALELTFAVVGIIVEAGLLTEDPNETNLDDKILVTPKISYGASDKSSLTAEITDITTKRFSEGIYQGYDYAQVTLSIDPQLPCTNAVIGLEFAFGKNIETEPDPEDEEESLYYRPNLAGGRDALMTVTEVGGTHEVAELTAAAASAVSITVKTKAVGSTRLDRAVNSAGKASIGSNGSLLLAAVKGLTADLEYLCFSGTGAELSGCAIDGDTLSGKANGTDISVAFAALGGSNTVSAKHGGFLVIRQTLAGGSRILYVFALTDDVPPSVTGAVYNGGTITVSFDEPLQPDMNGFYLEKINADGSYTLNSVTAVQDSANPAKVTVSTGGLQAAARYTLYLESGGVTDEQGKKSVAAQCYVSGISSSEPLLKSISFEHGFEYVPAAFANPVTYGSYGDTAVNYVVLGSGAQGLVSLELSDGAAAKYALTGSRASAEPSFYGAFSDGAARISGLTTGQYLYIQVTSGGNTEVYCFYISRAAPKAGDSGTQPVSSVTLRRDSDNTGTLTVNFNRTMAAINRGVSVSELTISASGKKPDGASLTLTPTVDSVYFEGGKLYIRFTADGLSDLSSDITMNLVYAGTHAFDKLISPGGYGYAWGMYGGSTYTVQV